MQKVSIFFFLEPRLTKFISHLKYLISYLRAYKFLQTICSRVVRNSEISSWKDYISCFAEKYLTPGSLT